MTKNYCTFIPSKGATLFRELRKQFGYSTARSVFLKALNPEFISKYKNTLSLDAEGIPTYDSLMKNTFMQSFLGGKRISEMLSSRYSALADTLDNYNNLLESAFQFNTTNDYRNNFIATVESVGEGLIGVVIQPKTELLTEKFKNQYSANKLNNQLVAIFKPLGITVGTLTDAEMKVGRIGVTDFSIARNIANGFASMIRVANNMEGATALSEEFSHLIIGIFRKDPIVTRSINALVNNEDSLKAILGDHYTDIYNFYNGDMSLVAEEALGHILQKNLLSPTELPSLFQRALNWIINKFKSFSLNAVQNAIDSADSMMNTLAQDILKGTRTINQSDIIASRREVQFNALSDKIDRNIEILKNVVDTEAKRFRIAKGDIKEKTSVLLKEMQSYLKEDADTAEGILHYAHHALMELRGLEGQLRMLDSFPPDLKFQVLRNTRTYTQSYGRFIKALNDALISDEEEADNMFLREFSIEGGNTTTIQEVIQELNSLSESLTRRYSMVAFPAFAEFIKPFMGEEITIPYGTYAGTKLSVDTLLKEAEHDISFMDRWLDSMADSADLLLQGFDAVVKKANTNARLETIDNIRTIQAFREKAEKQGITDFEWMFETDNEGNKSGNYISEINYAQFAKDLKDFTTYINDKYGKNPTGDEAQAKLAEVKAWRKEHCVSVFTSSSPNSIKYKNKQFAKLTTTQKALLNEFLTLKEKFDAKLPSDKVARNKAIQIRKSGTQRLFDSLTSPNALIANLKEMAAASLLDKEDDDQLFGTNKTSRSLTDFSGKEYMTIPVLYTNILENPNELSTDVVGSLMAYAYMANQYEELEKIVDPLEVGRTLLEERNVKATRGGKQVIEKFKAAGLNITNPVLVSKSNSEQKLDDFFESQIYHRYLKDEGSFDVLGKQVNTNKFVSLLLKTSSMAQLGFNWLANMANVATGLSMQNIEAAAGQFFTPKELAKADLEYGKNLTPMLAELGSRTKTNKLSLFFELFDVKQDFGNNVKSMQNKSWLKRLFGADIAFLGQAAGDHWLYGRTAIAMALKEKVLLGSKEISLWDALQVVDTKKGSTKELNYKDIKSLDGASFDVNKFSRKVAHINQSCFGIYNDEDSNAANRVAMGRLLQQYRKWMKAQYNRRFQAVQRNLATDTWEEGYYRTVGRIMNQLLRGQIQLAGQWDRMSLEEKANVKRAIMEMVQFFAVWALANWIEWPDDKKRPWAQKLAEYSCKRLAHELGGLAPSTVMPQELLKTVKNPLPSTSTVQNLFNLVNSCVDPTDWDNTISSGPYKGMSTLQKNFIKSPLPIVPQYRQIDKFIGDLDTSIQYYMRPSN